MCVANRATPHPAGTEERGKRSRERNHFSFAREVVPKQTPDIIKNRNALFIGGVRHAFVARRMVDPFQLRHLTETSKSAPWTMMESSTRSSSRVTKMEPNVSMLQIKSTSTFSRRIGANGPKAINSNILKRGIGIVLVLPKQSGSMVGNAATCDVAALAPFRDPGLDTLAAFGGAMKQGAAV
jgi:hypothetical protein